MICISCITSCTSATLTYPIFSLANSMGSFLSRSYAAHFGKELAGAIFCGTGELPASLEGVVSAFDKVVDKIGPHANADLLFKIGNGVFNAQFKNPRTNVDWISTSEENLDRYLDDPLCGFNFKLGGTRDVVRILMEVSRKDWAQKVPQDLPIMLISARRFRWLQRQRRFWLCRIIWSLQAMSRR